MVEVLRNKNISKKTGLGRKLFRRISQKQVQYHKETKLWIPHRKRVYIYWFKFLQIAEQDPHRKVNWKKYQGWGGSNYILGVNFDEWWNTYGRKLMGLKTLKDKQKFPLTTTKPKIESIRTSLLVYQKLHLKSYLRIAKEIQESELTNRKGVKDFKDATNNVIMEFGIYNTKNIKIKKKEITKKGIGEFKKTKLSAPLIKERFGNLSADKSALDRYKNVRVYREKTAESKKIIIGAVNHYRKTAESILDGVCEGKYPETPDMRKNETFERGKGKIKSTAKKSILQKVDKEVQDMIETYEDAEDSAIKMRTQSARDDLKKMEKYKTAYLTKEELEEKRLMNEWLRVSGRVID